MGKIQLNAASGGGSVSLQAPSSMGSDRVYNLPDSDSISTLAGILEFDQFYLTSDLSSNGDITTNITRNDFTASAAPLGSGMSLSGGIFTFPSTGKYLVICTGQFSTVGSDNIVINTKVTTNNSSYTTNTRCIDGNNGSGDRSGSATSFAFLNVTNTSQLKVKFNAESIGSGSRIRGDSTKITTNFIFARLGDI